MNARPGLLLALCCLLFSAVTSGHARAQETLSDERILEILRGPWFRTRTPHFRVSTDHRGGLDAHQLSGLETSFRRIADELGISQATRDSIESDPIRFFFTRHLVLLDQLGGMGNEGVSFPDRGVIVSTRLPHAHEVAHVLIQVATRSRAPHTAPLLQEGLATMWGGTADAAPRVHFEVARRLLTSRRVFLVDFLYPDSFESLPMEASARYSISALFCEYFRERFSLRRLLDLYRLLSAPFEELRARPVAAVVLQFEGFSGMSFNELELDFRRWAEDRRRGGIEFTRIPAVEPDGFVSEKDHWVRWWWRAEELVVEMGTTSQSTVDAEVLWGETLRSRGRSDLRQPAWRRWGFRVHPEGAELTDHRARRQLAALPTDRLDDSGLPDSRSRHWVLRIDLAGMVDLHRGTDMDLLVTPRFQPGFNAQPRERD